MPTSLCDTRRGLFVAQSVTRLPRPANGTVVYTLRFVVRNATGHQVNDVQAQLNLTNAFLREGELMDLVINTPTQVTVTSSIGVANNGAFDGVTDQNLLSTTGIIGCIGAACFTVNVVFSDPLDDALLVGGLFDVEGAIFDRACDSDVLSCAAVCPVEFDEPLDDREECAVSVRKQVCGPAKVGGSVTSLSVAQQTVCPDEFTVSTTLCPVQPQAPTIIYVDVNSPGGAPGNGISWATAYTSLQSALQQPPVAGTNEIWVAQGTYYPDTGPETPGDRNATFTLVSGVGVYGGFTGTSGATESERCERNSDARTNGTVLSGNIGNVATNSDNSEHVVTVPANAVLTTTILDGFTVRDGFTGAGEGAGVAWLSNGDATFANCVFSYNISGGRGGATRIFVGNEAVFCSCDFVGNRSDNRGGAIFTQGSSSGGNFLHCVNCSFRENFAGRSGGGLSAGFTCALINCEWIGNFSNANAGNDGGGAINSEDGLFTIVNNTFTRNISRNPGGALYSSSGGAFLIQNSILWGDRQFTDQPNESSAGGITTIENCIVENGLGGITGAPVAFFNIKANDPQFVSPPVDVRLQSTSPGINCGDNTALTGLAFDVPYDLDDFDRIAFETVDLGPYEYQGAQAASKVSFVVEATNSGKKALDNVNLVDQFDSSVLKFCGACPPPKEASLESSLCPTAAEVDPSTDVFYVTANGMGGGTSWADAGSLVTALTVSAKPEVWVQAGIYDAPLSTAGFTVARSVRVYGGFSTGMETRRDERDPVPETNATILQRSPSQGTGRVLTFNTVGINVLFDGFTIQNGYKTNFGAGFSVNNGNLTLRNVLVTKNSGTDQGGGARVNGNNSTLTICDTRMIENEVDRVGDASGFPNGGALYITNGATLRALNVEFRRNRVAIGNGTANANPSGGAISLLRNGGDMNATLVNCVFTDNVVEVNSTGGGARGGAISLLSTNNLNSSLHVVNTTFNGNVARRFGSGGGGFVQGGAISVVEFTGASAIALLENCIFWGDDALTGREIYAFGNTTVVTISDGTIVQDPNAGGNFAGGGATLIPPAPYATLKNEDPLFVDAPNDVRLQLTPIPSPAFDCGDNAHLFTLPFTVPLDLEGNRRINNDVVDLGAYERASRSWCDLEQQLAHQCFAPGDSIPLIVRFQPCVEEAKTMNRAIVEAIAPSAIVADISTLCPEEPELAPVYVKASATGANDGSSWDDAYTDLQAALAAAVGGVNEIWIARGTYKPTTGTDRTISFTMVDGVNVYGGFAGTNEIQRSERDSTPETNGTILSGDIGSSSDTSDNAFHVVLVNNDTTCTIEGVTIRDGNADGAGTSNCGGGIFTFDTNVSLTLRNVIVEDNLSAGAQPDGAGIKVSQGNTVSLTVCDCVFRRNICGADATGGFIAGGAVRLEPGNVGTFLNTVFENNEVRGVLQTQNSGALGGAIAMRTINGDSLTIVNCQFYNNFASNSGGAIWYGNTNVGGASTGTMNVVNCSFASNEAAGSTFGGGALYSDRGARTVTNCIMWGNVANVGAEIDVPAISTGTLTVAHSIVEGGIPGSQVNDPGNNITVGNQVKPDDPAFVNEAAGNLRLQDHSPAIDCGLNSALMAPSIIFTVPSDLDGFTRIHNGTVDLGPYENQPTTESASDDQMLCITEQQKSATVTATRTSASSVTSGGTATFTVSVKNTSNVPLTGVILTVAFDSERLVIAQSSPIAPTALADGLLTYKSLEATLASGGVFDPCETMTLTLEFTGTDVNGDTFITATLLAPLSPPVIDGVGVKVV